MKPAALLCLLVICLDQVRTEDIWWEKVKAPKLTNSLYKAHVGKDKYVLIEFYSKSSTSCQDLYPELNQVYEDLKSGTIKRTDFEVFVAEGEEIDGLEKKLGITSYPSLYLYKPGDKDYPEVYRFGRDYESIRNYIMSQVPAPAISEGTFELP